MVNFQYNRNEPRSKIISLDNKSVKGARKGNSAQPHCMWVFVMAETLGKPMGTSASAMEKVSAALTATILLLFMYLTVSLGAQAFLSSHQCSFHV